MSALSSSSDSFAFRFAVAFGFAGALFFAGAFFVFAVLLLLVEAESGMLANQAGKTRSLFVLPAGLESDEPLPLMVELSGPECCTGGDSPDTSGLNGAVCCTGGDFSDTSGFFGAVCCSAGGDSTGFVSLVSKSLGVVSDSIGAGGKTSPNKRSSNGLLLLGSEE